MSIVYQKCLPAVMVLTCLLSAAANASTFPVDSLLDGVDQTPGDGVCQTTVGTCTLRAAVMEANAWPGTDEIELPAGVFTFSLDGEGEDGALTGDLDLTESVTVIGQGSDLTAIDAAQLDRIFELVDGFKVHASLSDMTLTQGLIDTGSINARSGGAMRIAADSEVHLQSVHFVDNTAGHGGAVWNAGRLIGHQVQWLHNEGQGAGGALNNTGTGFEVQLSDCLFAHNIARSAGALVNTADFSGPRGQVTLDRCAFVFNQSTNTGVVLNNTHTDMTISNTTISNNQTSDGVLFNDGGAIFHLRNVTIVNNQASGIAEVHHNDQFIFMRNSVLAANQGSLGVNCNLRLTSEGGNYFGDLTGCDPTLHASDILGSDDPGVSPLLTGAAPWQWLHWPLVGSALIDAGLAANCEATDLLANSRPLDSDFDGVSQCTIGATEPSEVIFKSGI